MRRLGILVFGIMGQGLWASEEVPEHKEDEPQVLQHYPSQDIREEQLKKIVAKNIEASGPYIKYFKDDIPRALIIYRAQTALVKGQIPLESPQLAADIHNLKKIPVKKKRSKRKKLPSSKPYVGDSSSEPTKIKSSPSGGHSVERSHSSAKIAPLELESCEYDYTAQEDLTPRGPTNAPKQAVSEPCCPLSCIIL